MGAVVGACELDDAAEIIIHSLNADEGSIAEAAKDRMRRETWPLGFALALRVASKIVSTGPMKLAGMLIALALVSGGAGLTTSAAPDAEGGWHRVAAIDIAHPEQSGFATSASPYRYSTREIPAQTLAADAPERRVLFCSTMEFRFTGVKPEAKYQLRASFLSDSGERVEQIEAGAVTLAERLVLPKHQILSRTWEVPAGAVTGGDLTLGITALAGANAVVSSLEIWSTDPTPLKSPPSVAEKLAQIAVPMPRLSPRPAGVAGLAGALLSLNGRWKFNPLSPEEPGAVSAASAASWRDIEVPAEWVMQGFKVEANRSACYVREFDLPAQWSGQRIKLRFDAVHSECKVWVNGHAVGGHEGGFVPFELDVTDAAQPGANTLVVTVRNESIADLLASATQYAGHPLGGITRKVTLFAVPNVNVAAQVITTTFGPDFKDAALNLRVEIANESAADAEASLGFQLISPAGQPVAVDPGSTVARAVRAGQTLAQQIAIPVVAPRQWDTEHPNLYTLRTELKSGQATEVITQRFGFRQVEVRGNQVFVNNHPIKLHGVCRHETHPLVGRSLTPALWRKDAEIFRAANVNYIRTSHYPPAEEFLDACDELGLFVECESPLCWVQHGANSPWGKLNYQDSRFFPYLMRANLENIAANRNHPSIVIWSLANESLWSPLFAEVLKRVKQVDPSRPTSFHDQSWGDYNAGGSQADIANYHYPDTNGPARCDQGSRPTLFGEYCHVQTYNQREHFTDPGVRDQWGPRFAEMYDLMYRHQGCLGGAIWSGIDEAFDLPDGQVEGYGYWGVIDGWRRAKPETFHVRKAYSPIRVVTRELPANEGPLRIGVENRYNFANLAEVGIEWSLGGETGRTTADIPPRTAGEIVVAPKRELADGGSLRLKFTAPRGFVCEEVEVPVGRQPNPVAAFRALETGPLKLGTNESVFIVTGAAFRCEIDRQTGQFREVQVGGKPVLVGGPVLMVLPLDGGPCQPQDLTQFGPLNTLCKGWSARSVTAATESDGGAVIRVEGEYAEAAGNYTLRFRPGGALEISYDFISKQKVNPRQVGMVFFLDRDCDTLTWQRNAEWSVYPADHIGRPNGLARANPNDAMHIVHLTRAPDHPWSQDTTALGTADFRSSKARIVSSALRSPEGQGLALSSEGSQTVRAFVDGDRIGWLVARINAGGGEGFFSPHHAADRHPLQKGSKISDTMHFQLVGE
jgi:beta-galactosidase